MSEDKQGLSESVQSAVRSRMLGYGFNSTGVITAVKGRRVEVQPCINAKRIDGTIETRSIIPNVPLVGWSSGLFETFAPPKVGDEVFLVIAGRSINKFKENGGCVDPGEGRIFHKTDAVAIPTSISKPDYDKSIDKDYFWAGFRDGRAGLRINENGRVALGNDTGEIFNELYAVTSALLDFIDKLPDFVSDLTKAEQAKTAIMATGTPEPAAEAARLTAVEVAKVARFAGVVLELETALSKISGVKI